MTDDQIIEQLRELRYPGKVDVSDAVMEQVRRTPILAPARPARRVRRIVISVAACLLLAVGVNVTLFFTRSYDVASIGSTMADVYNYHADYGNTTLDYSLGGIEYLYE